MLCVIRKSALLEVVSAGELVTLDKDLYLLGALDAMASISRPLCFIHKRLLHLLVALVSLGVCARSSGGVMAAREVLPTARCEFDSRPELHLKGR